MILSFDVTRLARNCSDWYPLLDVCGYRNCLIADRDSLYDPGNPNGRLLLGLKGQLSELELQTIRTRLTAGLLHKAERGELALTLPVGLVRDRSGIVLKDPNREVQSRLALIFSTFLQVRSASKVLRTFNAENLMLPRRNRFGDIIWRKPSVAAILFILKHPAYAGAFTYGRYQTIRTGPGPHQAKQKRLPMEHWRVRVNDKYPAYISWATYEQIQAMLQDNYAEYDRHKTRGIPRPGKALLHGLVYCGKCGHKMVVQYTQGTRYLCNSLRQQYAVPVCQHLPAEPVDTAAVEAFLAALSPLELDVYTQALKAEQQTLEATDQARRQQLERLRYQAALAERQFNQSDPDNRLVTAELEKRWEMALRELKHAEQATSKAQQNTASTPAFSTELKAAFTEIGQKLPALWATETLSRTQKKALLRCLIDKVVVHRQPQDQLQTRIVWKGGDVTTLTIPITVGSIGALSNGAELENRIVELARDGVDDERIAQQLTTEGFRSPMNPARVLVNTVRCTRLKYGILVTRSQSHPRRIAGYLTITQLAHTLEISAHWIYDRIHNGTIHIARDTEAGVYLFPDEPQTLQQFKQLQEGKRTSLRF